MFTGYSPSPGKQFATAMLCRSFKSQYEPFMLVDLCVEEWLHARLMYEGRLWLEMKHCHVFVNLTRTAEDKLF